MNEKKKKGFNFSKTLIIHAGKTYREGGLDNVIPIITQFGELLLWISLIIINVLRIYTKHTKDCFIIYPDTSNLVKKNPTHFSVFGYLMKHSSLCLKYYLQVGLRCVVSERFNHNCLRLEQLKYTSYTLLQPLSVEHVQLLALLVTCKLLLKPLWFCPTRNFQDP